MSARARSAGLALALAAAAAGCTDARQHQRAICVLVDVSGTYADQRADVVRIVKSGLLPRVRPGDTFMVIRIGDQSYDRESVEATATLDSQPSHANAQKLRLAGQLDRFAAGGARAKHTDVSGAILLAAEYLRETQAGRKAIVIFSDMKEELPKGARRDFEAEELAGIEVLAMNVKRLGADQLDPSGYRRRLTAWEARLTAARAERFKVLLDPEELARELEQL